MVIKISHRAKYPADRSFAGKNRILTFSARAQKYRNNHASIDSFFQNVGLDSISSIWLSAHVLSVTVFKYTVCIYVKCLVKCSLH